jgi:hypothetical protein
MRDQIWTWSNICAEDDDILEHPLFNAKDVNKKSDILYMEYVLKSDTLGSSMI